MAAFRLGRVPALFLRRRGRSRAVDRSPPHPSLLRTRPATGIQHWQEGAGEATVPVLVQAAALAGRRPMRSPRRSLRNCPRTAWPALPTGFFATPPYRDVPWLVLVDGLDEVTDPAARRAVVSTIMEMRDDDTASHYRFAVATRPLPSGELDALDRAAGSGAGGSGSAERVARYTLQPFTTDDLPRIARSWFEAFQLPDVDRVVTRFLESLPGGVGPSRNNRLHRSVPSLHRGILRYTRRPTGPPPPSPDGLRPQHASHAEERSAPCPRQQPPPPNWHRSTSPK